jgi:hypothetical protein
MSYPDAKIAATNAAGRRSAPAINPDERSGLAAGTAASKGIIVFKQWVIVYE